MTTITLNFPEGCTSHDVLVETACRLYDAQKLRKTDAARICHLTSDEFNAALMARGLPVIPYMEEMLEEDMKAVEQMRLGSGRLEPGQG